MSYYDGDSWSNHRLNEIKCGECEQEYDEQEGEGNICPTCKEKEGENNMYHLQLNERELRDLLLSVQFDRTGKYGDERSYRLEKLETKLKRVKPIEGEGK
jgi:hypothetical protein